MNPFSEYDKRLKDKAFDSCNNCDAIGLAPGQDRPGQPGYCINCLEMSSEESSAGCAKCGARISKVNIYVANDWLAEHVCEKSNA